MTSANLSAMPTPRFTLDLASSFSGRTPAAAARRRRLSSASCHSCSVQEASGFFTGLFGFSGGATDFSGVFGSSATAPSSPRRIP